MTEAPNLYFNGGKITEHMHVSTVPFAGGRLYHHDAEVQRLVAEARAERVTVNPLEWSSWREDANYPACSAISELDFWYKVDTSEARWEKPDYPVFFRSNCHEDFTRITECDSLAEAKAAAQADYERRILSAISDAPPRQVTPQQAAKVLLKGGNYAVFEPAFSAMEAQWEEGPEAAFSAALRALANGGDSDG